GVVHLTPPHELRTRSPVRFFPDVPGHGRARPCERALADRSAERERQLTFFSASREATVAVSAALRMLVTAPLTCERATLVRSMARRVEAEERIRLASRSPRSANPS